MTPMTQSYFLHDEGSVILCMGSTNERKHYSVTPLTGWAHTQNDPRMMAWHENNFLHYLPFVRGIHLDSPHKGPVMQRVFFLSISWLLAKTNCWTNSTFVSDLRCHDTQAKSMSGDLVQIITNKRMSWQQLKFKTKNLINYWDRINMINRGMSYSRQMSHYLPLSFLLTVIPTDI